LVKDRFITKISSALAKFERACVGQEQKQFEDIRRNPDEEAIKTLQSYCIVK
jgi:hypothetical protein